MTNSNLQHITHKIYFFRGVPVLLDRDLAQWFEVKPIRLREQVKRNIKRFPKHFRFVLNEQEVDVLLSQNAIPSRKVLGGSLPQVFTEYGVLQLANVLRSEKATEMSVMIIEAFVALRQYALNYEALATALKTLEGKTDYRFAEVSKVLDALLEQKQQQDDFEHRQRIGFKSILLNT